MANKTTDERLDRLEAAVGQVGLALKQTNGFRPLVHGRHGAYTELAELMDTVEVAARTGTMETRPASPPERRAA